MWGNKPGWFISAIIAAVMGWMIWTLGRTEGIPRPSGMFTNLEQRIAIPVPPAEAMPDLMTEDRDAGDQYRQAIRLYADFPKEYETTKPPYYDRRTKLPAVQLLVDAATAKRATIFLTKPEALVNYRYPWPELDALMKLGGIANSIAFSAQARKDEETTKKYAHACFALGAKLYDERLVHGELDVGLKLMQSAGDTLKSLAKRQGNTAELERWQRFTDQTSSYYTTSVQKLYQKVVSGAPLDLQRHSGDVFALALKNPDRMWRTEALLKLGRYKFERGGTVNDQMWANRVLSEPERAGIPDLTKDPDAAVRTAATAARDLTVEEFNQIR